MEVDLLPRNPAAAALAPLLDGGEQLLWSGQPKQGLLLQAGDIFAIPFSLGWGGFAVFWEMSALGFVQTAHVKAPTHDAIAWIFPLFGVPFVLVGLYMIVGRFFFDAAARKKTFYGLTSARLMILKSSLGRSLTSYDYASLTNLNLVERGDGSGDILFGSPTGPWRNADLPSRRTVMPGFYLLPDARRVYDQIRDVSKQARR